MRLLCLAQNMAQESTRNIRDLCSKMVCVHDVQMKELCSLNIFAQGRSFYELTLLTCCQRTGKRECAAQCIVQGASKSLGMWGTLLTVQFQLICGCIAIFLSFEATFSPLVYFILAPGIGQEQNIQEGQFLDM